MAYPNADYHNNDGFMTMLRRWFSAFGQSCASSFEAYGRRRSRIDQIERLNAKSDAELAEMGIVRDRIPHHVFADLMHL